MRNPKKDNEHTDKKEMTINLSELQNQEQDNISHNGHETSYVNSENAHGNDDSGNKLSSEENSHAHHPTDKGNRSNILNDMRQQIGNEEKRTNLDDRPQSYSESNASSSGNFNPSPISHTKPLNNRSKNKIRLLIFGFVVIFLVFLLPIGSFIAILLAGAISFGKGNVFSQVNKYLSTEDIPIVDSLSPSDEDILKSALTKFLEQTFLSLVPSDDALKKNTKTTMEINPDLKIKFYGITGQTEDFKMIYNYIVGENVSNLQQTFDLSGKVKTGLATVDFDENATKTIITQENDKNYRLDFDYSEAMIDQYLGSFEDEFEEILGENPYEFFKKTIKVNSEKIEKVSKEYSDEISDLQDKITKLGSYSSSTYLLDSFVGVFNSSASQTSSTENIIEFEDKFNEYFGKEIREIYKRNLIDNVDKYANITKKSGRISVESERTIQFNFELKEDEVEEVILNITKEWIDLILSKQEESVEMCKLYAKLSGIEEDTQYYESAKEDCDNIDFDDLLDEKEEILSDIKNSLNGNLFKYINVENLSINIDPSNYDLVKLEFKLLGTEALFGLTEEEPNRDEATEGDGYEEESFKIDTPEIERFAFNFKITNIPNSKFSDLEDKESVEGDEVLRKIYEESIKSLEKELEDSKKEVNKELEDFIKDEANQASSYYLDSDITTGDKNGYNGVIIESFDVTNGNYLETFEDELYKNIQDKLWQDDSGYKYVIQHQDRNLSYYYNIGDSVPSEYESNSKFYYCAYQSTGSISKYIQIRNKLTQLVEEENSYSFDYPFGTDEIILDIKNFFKEIGEDYERYNACLGNSDLRKVIEDLEFLRADDETYYSNSIVLIKPENIKPQSLEDLKSNFSEVSSNYLDELQQRNAGGIFKYEGLVLDTYEIERFGLDNIIEAYFEE